MAKERKNKKNIKNITRTITGRSLLVIVLMGILMVLATSAAASVQMVKRNMAIYKKYAQSYATMISTNIDGKTVHEYLELDKELEGIEDEEKKTSKKEEVIYSNDYLRVSNLLRTSASYADLRYIYVVVPKDDYMIYLWDVAHINLEALELSEEEYNDLSQEARFLEHDSYTAEEEKPMKEVMAGTWDKRMFTDTSYQKQMLGTVLAPVYDIEGSIVAVVGVDIDLEYVTLSVIGICLNVLFAISAVLAVCMVIYYFLIRERLIHPIVKLKNAADSMVENLDSGNKFSADIHTGDEIEALAKSFEEMDDRLHRYIDENMAITAEREHLKTELNLARRIQADMLPSVFPPFPERKEFDVYASMTPAKEVGGDFYDFFFIDEDHLALVIADVSGKGIPAALFMMMSKIMLQNYTLTGMSPKEVLQNVNEQICRNNHEDMFVTVWLGIWDIPGGVICAANAGHEFPMLKTPEGGFELLRDRHGLVLGGMEGIHYKEYEIEFPPGSKLFVYTDGVAEAADNDNKLFGTDMTLESLNRVKDGTPGEILEAVHADVDRFVGEAPQFDDMTMLCISCEGSNS